MGNLNLWNAVNALYIHPKTNNLPFYNQVIYLFYLRKSVVIYALS